MFADRTKVFHFHHHIKIIFETGNCELKNIIQWISANELLLNIKKTKYTLFHKYSIKDKIPLKLPTLEKRNKVMEKTQSIKFLIVMLDKHLSWKYHIKTVENKLSKNIVFLCRTKQFLDEIFFKNIYFSYVCFFFFFNYANITWVSAHSLN